MEQIVIHTGSDKLNLQCIEQELNWIHNRCRVKASEQQADHLLMANIIYRDITSGNHGAPCLVGFDLCSGPGSWNGVTP
jgi:hypothetical protein